MIDLFALVKKLRDRIEKYEYDLRMSEALTRYVLIDPVLRALDWDTENPDVVRPEESEASGSPDYILYNEGKKLIALEAKKLGTGLDEKRVLDPAFKYNWQNGIPYFIITDGNLWRVFDLRKMRGRLIDLLKVFDAKRAEDRLILEINVIRDPAEDVVKSFLSLWRPMVREIEPVKPAIDSFRVKREFQVEVGYKMFKGPLTAHIADLLVLYTLQGSKRPMRRKEIVKKVERIVELTDYDEETLKWRPRWEEYVQWAFTRLKKEGFIESPQRGFWRITYKGLQKLRRELQDLEKIRIERYP